MPTWTSCQPCIGAISGIFIRRPTTVERQAEEVPVVLLGEFAQYTASQRCLEVFVLVCVHIFAKVFQVL